MISSVGTFLHAVPETKAHNSSTSTNKSNFDAILASIKPNTETGSTAETDRTDLMKQVDQNDEAAATKELLALMKMLMFGKSTTALSKIPIPIIRWLTVLCGPSWSG